MGIDLRIPKWSNSDTVTHVSTTWEIHSNNSFTDLLDSNPEDTENKTRWISALQLPEGTTWYARCKRHFNDGTDSGWTNTTIIDYSQVIDYNSRDKDYVIETPLVMVNKKDVVDATQQTLHITCGDFKRLDNDTRTVLNTHDHASTCWLIYDGSTLLYSRLYDSVNKTNITINKTDIPNYETHNSLTVKAIYVDSNDKESSVGKVNIKDGEECVAGLRLYGY